MKMEYTEQALGLGWVTEGEDYTAKELREEVQDDIIAELTQNFIVRMHEGPLGKFQGTPEYDAELMKQINRIGKLFNIPGNVN